jgi:hypothetical protein
VVIFIAAAVSDGPPWKFKRPVRRTKQLSPSASFVDDSGATEKGNTG